MKPSLRFAAFLVSCLVLLSLLPATSAHAETSSKLTWGNFIYRLSDNEITIIGLTDDTTGAVIIPNRINGSKVVAISNYAFQHTEGITSLSTGGSVTSIGDFAFEYCSNLTEVNIGKSVTHIGEFAFKDCPKLAKINVVDPNPSFSSDLCGVLFNKDQTELISAPKASQHTYVIPATVTKIHAYAFEFCRQLSGVKMGSGVTTVGDHAFRGCTAMKTLTIGSNVKSIGEGAFSSCSALTSIVIPSSVTSIGKEAFHYCDSVTNLTIGDGIHTIPEGAFGNLHALKNLSIGKNVTTIGKEAFFRNEALTSVTIPDSVTHIDAKAFSYCDSLSQVTFGSGLRSIGDRVFHYSGVEQITFRGSAPTIHASAFWGKVLTARYPYPDESWTSNVLQDYEGEVTWESYLDPARTGKITGIVTYPNGGPADLSLWKPGASSASYTAISARGEYCMEHILPGEYLLKATKPNHAPLEYTVVIAAGKTTTQDLSIRLLGDITADNQISIVDVAMLYSHIRKTKVITDPYTLLCADYTGDGNINIVDVSRLYARIKQGASI